MALDKVQPLKLEDPTTGGDQLDLCPTELDPLEDHVECRGIVLANDTVRDDQVVLTRTGNNMTFKDGANPVELTLSDMLAGTVLHTHTTYLDVDVRQGETETFGTVTGLSPAPVHIVGYSIFEKDVGIAQSGYSWAFDVYAFTADGFHYRLAMIDDDYWPGPGAVHLRVSYVWSDT
jgi:hypothetical protein